MEQIDILNDQCEKTGEVRSIDDVHVFGLWHCSARLWIANSKNEILLQHRDTSSREFPDMWDVTAAGHVSAGHEPLEMAIIEAHEELGLVVSPIDIKQIERIKKQSISNNGTYIDNSFEFIYLMNKDVDINNLVMQKGEVQNLKWVPIEEFKKIVAEKSSELVPHWDEYELIINELEK